MSETSTQIPTPYEQMLQNLFGGWISRSLGALARLGVADHVNNTPKSVEEIAPLVGAKPDLLYRLMRATASVGVLAETPDHRFVETPLSQVLKTGANPGLRDVAIFTSAEWHTRSWSQLDQTIQTGQRPLEKIWGTSMAAFFASNGPDATAFHNGMTDLSSQDGPLVAEVYDFSGIKNLTDVGGGHGLLLASILKQNPGMKSTLYDLPQVVAGASGGPTEPVKNRVTITGGNMFESVPPGADAYIMKYIIHDWPDDLCLKILKGCRNGVNPGGKLLVLDSVIPGPNEFHMGKFEDLEMMLFPGGKERTQEEFRDLFAAAGWKLTRVIPTKSHLSIVEGVPA
jgi:hypothetical protein